MNPFATTDPRVNAIDVKTWIDGDSKYVFELQEGGIKVFNLRKGPGLQPALNEVPYSSLDAAIEAHLGPRHA